MMPARKAEAVARYYEITKFGLAEAKAVIEASRQASVPGEQAARVIAADREQQVYQGRACSHRGIPRRLLSSIAAPSALRTVGERAPTRDEGSRVLDLAQGGLLRRSRAADRHGLGRRYR